MQSTTRRRTSRARFGPDRRPRRRHGRRPHRRRPGRTRSRASSRAAASSPAERPPAPTRARGSTTSSGTSFRSSARRWRRPARPTRCWTWSGTVRSSRDPRDAADERSRPRLAILGRDGSRRSWSFLEQRTVGQPFVCRYSAPSRGVANASKATVRAHRDTLEEQVAEANVSTAYATRSTHAPAPVRATAAIIRENSPRVTIPRPTRIDRRGVRAYARPLR